MSNVAGSPPMEVGARALEVVQREIIDKTNEMSSLVEAGVCQMECRNFNGRGVLRNIMEELKVGTLAIQELTKELVRKANAQVDRKGSQLRRMTEWKDELMEEVGKGKMEKEGMCMRYQRDVEGFSKRLEEKEKVLRIAKRKVQEARTEMHKKFEEVEEKEVEIEKKKKTIKDLEKELGEANDKIARIVDEEFERRRAPTLLNILTAEMMTRELRRMEEEEMQQDGGRREGNGQQDGGGGEGEGQQGGGEREGEGEEQQEGGEEDGGQGGGGGGGEGQEGEGEENDHDEEMVDVVPEPPKQVVVEQPVTLRAATGSGGIRIVYYETVCTPAGSSAGGSGANRQ